MAGCTRFVETPESLSNHLAFLQLDLNDPDFYRWTLEHTRRLVAEIRSLLDAAVEARELVPCDTPQLARTVQVIYNGGLLTWAIYREGTAEQWMRQDLDTLLRPYRASGKPKAPARRRASHKSAKRRQGRS